MPRKIQMPEWTQEELTILKELYPLGGMRAARRGLPRRSQQAIALKAHELKLRSGAKGGVRTRFKPGQKPWNKGMKGFKPMESSRYYFKPGNRPHTWRPIGSERIDEDGYLVRKVSDERHPPGHSKRNWRAVHVIEWENHNGPAPPGHVVIFRNGDKTDARIENLELVDRRELMRRNTIHNYPKEIAQTIQLLGVIQRQINKREGR